MNVKMACMGLAVAMIAAPAFADEPDKAEFEAMCKTVSAADQLPEPAIAPFCGCLAEQAVKSEALYKELSDAAQSEPNPEVRMSKLSADGQAAVSACRPPA